MPPFIKIFSTKCYHLHCWGNLEKSIRRIHKLSRDCLCILLRTFGGEGKIITIKKLSIYGKIRVSVEALYSMGGVFCSWLILYNHSFNCIFICKNSRRISQMKQKILSLFLALSISAGLFPVVSSAENTGFRQLQAK